MSALSTRSQTTPLLGDTSPSTSLPPRVRHQHSPSSAIRSLFLPGPAGRLEAILNQGSSDAPLAALVCHPHPLFGGSLHNKVVYHAMKALNDPAWGLGLPVLRFNFRGVGLSEGGHDGQAEVEDVFAALDWLDREFRRPILLAGFSFGAAIALRACCRAAGSPRVHAVIALGLPTISGYPAGLYSCLEHLDLPKLFVSGDRDPFSSPAELEQIVAVVAEPRRLVFLRGADHFFTGQLEPMQHAMAGWSKERMP